MPEPYRRSSPQLKESVIKTLLYYDVFNYPLQKKEVYRFLGTNSITIDDVCLALQDLTIEGKIYCYDEYFSIQSSKDNLLRRIKGNKLAVHYESLAYSRARLISQFPFVQGVMASGSFSKNYMDEESDLDFFIVTAPGRLWIVRMMLALFKRIIFLNSHKTFCCNYFIDTNHLEIEEKNIFTATELATLIPLAGPRHYKDIMKANSWLLDYLPNIKFRPITKTLDVQSGFIKRWLEKILSNRIGDLLDNYLLEVNQKRLKRLYARTTTNENFETSFKSKKNVSKNHPRHHQVKVVELYEKRIKCFFEKNQLIES